MKTKPKANAKTKLKLNAKAKPKAKAKTARVRRPAAGQGIAPPSFKKILVPVDFSEASIKVLKYAAAFARHFQAKIVLVHVVEPIATPDMEYLPMVYNPERIVEMATRKLKVLSKPADRGPKLVAQALVRSGKPFREITDVARELGIDLILIATHGYTGLERALLGSTAERVVRHAPCPVLTLHDPE